MTVAETEWRDSIDYRNANGLISDPVSAVAIGDSGHHASVSPYALIRYLRLHNVWRVLGQTQTLGLFRLGGEVQDDYSLKPFVRTNSVFVHLPKTGGVSISHALYGSRGMGHLTLAQWRALFRPRAFANMFKFTFVRNPFDRIHSAYHFLRLGGLDRLDAEFDRQVLKNFPTFEHLVLQGLDQNEVTGFWHFLPDTHFLSWEGGGPVELDFVGRYETLDRDFGYVRERVNPAAKLGHFNRTPGRQDYRRAYTADMVDRVARQYSSDLDLFGYDFDGPARPIRLISATGASSTMWP